MTIKRVHSVDIVRGIVMIIMALDHTRDLLHVSSISQPPTDLNTTTVAVFFTRWVTYLCAPVFVFLSGSAAFLSFMRKNDPGSARRFLITRGLWLIVLEFTVVNFGLWFDIHFNVFLFNVIAAIGFGFIILGLLIGLGPGTIGIAGLAIICLHNLAPLVPFGETSLFKQVLMPFFAPAAFPFDHGRVFIVGYPPIPWLGIMLAGYGAGRWFQWDPPHRRRLFSRIGSGALLLFLVIRLINSYGDSFPWKTQKTDLFTVLSFINVTKYPPSLQFDLLFLGIMFLLLAAVEGVQNKFARVTTVYGKVPLFYFLVHWYIIHPVLFIMVYAQGFRSQDLVFGFNFGRPKEGSGLPLWGVYLVWIAVVLLMYPLCKCYGRYKELHPEKKWLRYL